MRMSADYFPDASGKDPGCEGFVKIWIKILIKILMFFHSFFTSGEKCTGGKHAKNRVTVLLCANATGNEKLQPLVIGKYKKPRCFAGLRVQNLRHIWNQHESLDDLRTVLKILLQLEQEIETEETENSPSLGQLPRSSSVNPKFNQYPTFFLAC